MVALLLAGLATAFAAYAFSSRPSGTSEQKPVSVKYITESGAEGSEGTVNSPLKLQVRILRANGEPETLLVSANVQLLDDAGKPAEYGGRVEEPAELTPSGELGVLEYSGSVPGKEGTYHPRVQWQALSPDPQVTTSLTQTLELKSNAFRATPDSGPPMSSGYVFSDRSNLWIMSTDGKRQRRLTYLPAFSQYAITPDWAPDGSRLAFVYLPQVDPNQFPLTDIWTIKPDGSDVKQLIRHGENDSLLHPRWSRDGKRLYFTVESGPYDTNQTAPPGTSRHVEILDMATGSRSQWMPNAQMAASDGPDSSVVYLEFATELEADASGAVPQRLVIANADGSGKKVLVDAGAFQGMSAPQISPDGKWVAFAGINAQPPTKSSFDFMRWLLFQPEVAYAHGNVYWDIYLVSTAGSAPVRLTSVEEDEPYPVWLDNATVSAMGVRGLYKVQVGADGKPAGGPLRVRAGAPHGGLTWHAP